MAYQTIKDLPSANINLDENLNLQGTYLCVYNNQTMNMTDINNLPIHNKYKIDKAIGEVEEALTEKLQQKNFIGQIYGTDDDGNLILSNKLKLVDIADKLKKYNTQEVGVRFNLLIQGVEGYSEKRVVKQGDKVYYEGINIEASDLEMGINVMNTEDNSVTEAGECLATKCYPWNEMKKVQISMDDTEFNYDMDIDNGGNYFTEVPLYFIKEEFILEKETVVQGINGEDAIEYTKLADITSNFDNINIRNSIPAEFAEEAETDECSIGHYIWISKYPLLGYRPAEFFVDSVKGNVVEYDPDINDNDKKYIKIIINERVLYQEYRDYLESDLFGNEEPKLYCIIDNGTDEYVEVLETKHYFGCYEASTENYGGKEVLVSKPDRNPERNKTIDEFRNNINNLGPNYYLHDIRSHSDFFCNLLITEYKTCYGVYNILPSPNNLYNRNRQSPLFVTNLDTTSNIYLPYYYSSYYITGQTIDIGTKNDNILYNSIASNRRIIDNSKMIENEDFIIEKDNGNNPINYYLSVIDGERIFSTEDIQQTNDIYYKVTMFNSLELYVKLNTTGTGMMTSIPSGLDDIDCVYYYNGDLYATNSSSSLNKNLEDRLLCKIKIDGDPINLKGISSFIISSSPWKTGYVDIINSRTCYFENEDCNLPFKWNWIENPYGNLNKFIDGIYSFYSYEGDRIPDVIEFYNVCNNTEKYGNTDSYKRITRFYTDSHDNNRISISYDPLFPWVKTYTNRNIDKGFITSISDIFFNDYGPIDYDYGTICTTGYFASNNVGLFGTNLNFIENYKSRFTGVLIERKGRRN